MKRYLLFILVPVIIGCSSTPAGRVVVDSSPNKPSWATSNKITWNDGEKVMIKSSHTVRGNERLDGCYSLAKLDAQENLLTEIAAEVRGSVDNAQESINEEADNVLGKVRSAEFAGKITGLRISEQYFERYRIGDTERIECLSLSEVSKSDYERIKLSVIQKVAEADPRLKEAITKKQINFFSKSEPESGGRASASIVQDKASE